MHVQIFLSILFGIGILMSGIPYRKIWLKQSVLVISRGVCIKCSLRILYRTRMFMFSFGCFILAIFCTFTLWF